MVAKNQRCHIKNTGEMRAKTKGVINFSKLRKLSLNLYDTFEKCVINTRKAYYSAMVFRQGVIRFTTPYDTFMTPFKDSKGYSPALKNSQKGFFMTPFTQEPCRSALQAGLRSTEKIQGVVRCHKAFLLCAQRCYVRCRISLRHLSFNQEVLPWQY